MFTVNNRDTRTTPMASLTFSLTVSLLLTLNIFHTCSSVSIVNFEQVNTGWAVIVSEVKKKLKQFKQ